MGTWEIWNEPNHAGLWQRPDAARYVRLLTAAERSLDAAAPSDVVLSGGLSPYGSRGDVGGSGTVNPVTFVEQMYAAGAKGSFDALGAHPYSAPVGPTHRAPWNAFQQLPAIHEVMAANGDGAKQIWCTEYGAPTRGRDAVSEHVQARWVVEAFEALGDWSWAGPLLWYSHRDRGTDAGDREDWFGLRRHDGTAKPGLVTFRAAAG
ncbi:MAG: hypothetical protein H0U89_03705 [Acidimicrobiia bacterium]|nr:hypothetical protein [Acidimicrobiia bacterium]